jgi:hypothetical protein
MRCTPIGAHPMILSVSGSERHFARVPGDRQDYFYPVVDPVLAG